MNKEDYTSDTDESDEDFHPDNLACGSSASEDEKSGSNEELNDITKDNKGTHVKRKRATKKVIKKEKSKNLEEEVEDDLSKRSTRHSDEVDNVKGRNLDKDELVSDEEDKSRTNALWADFLKDVNPMSNSTKSNTSEFGDKASSSSTDGKVFSEKSPETKRTRLQTSSVPKVEDNKIVVTEFVNFAGEDMRIEREVDASSVKENKAASIPPAKKQPFGRIMPGIGVKRALSSGATSSAGGLGSLLNQLDKKKKLSVLEKSQMDWKSFKQAEGIDEQLQAFNKGKDGYLERQDFLQRTDLRQFEIEKNLRQTSRRPF